MIFSLTTHALYANRYGKHLSTGEHFHRARLSTSMSVINARRWAVVDWLAGRRVS